MRAKNVLLLFACCYAWLYMFPAPLNEVPGLDLLFSPYQSALEWLTLWFGKYVLGIADLKKIEMTGSGDTTYDYVLIPVKLALALLLSLASMRWLLRSGQRFDTFLFWTRTAIRWYVGLYMMIYGLAKIVEGGQFGSPGLYDLNQRYGDFSPMGLLWRFMGFSHPYAAFTGFAEVLGGALLLFRRTATLGALVTAGVMAHVFMLNMCYDVPVKLFSFHLLILALGLAAQNLGRLWQFFILQRPVSLIPEPDRLNKRWMVIARHGLRALCVGAMAFTVLYFTFGAERDKPDETPLRGIYDVVQFDYPPALPVDSLRWNRVVVEYNRMRIFTDNNKAVFYRFQADSSRSEFVLKSYRDSTEVFPFTVLQDSTNLHINGLWKKDTLRATLRRVDDSKFLLTSRGFHWINEYPFNR